MSAPDRSEAIRKALDGAPVSRREVARRAGVSHSTLNRIVSGEQKATDALADAIADALRSIGRESCKGARRIEADTRDAGGA